MKILSIKTIYWLLISLLSISLIQAIVKYFSPYYFNVVLIGILSVIMILFGLKLKVSKIFIIIFGIISLALVTLLYMIVWN